MAKRVFLVHGWGGSPENSWFVWLTKELQKGGFEVYAPKFPDSENPQIDEWVSTLEDAVGKSDKDTYFIGHSIGCQTIMRYLEKVNVKVGGALFIAGWFYLGNLEESEMPIAEPWTSTSIDLQKVRKNIGKVVVMISANDPFGFASENAKIFKKELGAEVIIKENAGHFDEPIEPYTSIALTKFRGITK